MGTALGERRRQRERASGTPLLWLSSLTESENSTPQNSGAANVFSFVCDSMLLWRQLKMKVKEKVGSEDEEKVVVVVVVVVEEEEEEERERGKGRLIVYSGLSPQERFASSFPHARWTARENTNQSSVLEQERKQKKCNSFKRADATTRGLRTGSGLTTRGNQSGEAGVTLRRYPTATIAATATPSRRRGRVG
ncbi:hypothetical protein O3P69_016983 [Scylla paramamosain]|uniref:Uncharacterized protein n=1 Tax=Scylla paramamosain TaxID=85552 RepID=A0AAW0TU00_SCYPA